MPFHAVLYDFDGTLADSFAAITASANHVRGLHALPNVSEEAVRRHVGLGLENLMETLVPGAPTDVAVQQYRAHHASTMLAGTTLMPGVLETLRTLHGRGVKQAVCSNKRVEFTKQLVAALGLGPYVAEVLGPDDVGTAKPDPAMVFEALRRLGVSKNDAVYIGDMAVDVHTARAAGVAVWIVPGGASGQESAEAAAPDRVLAEFRQVMELV